jgi:hypothetical protein
VDARAVGDVVVDRFRERVGLLEHHADAGAQLHRVDARVVDILAVERDVALDAATSIVSFIRLRQRRKVDLPQPDGPMKAVTVLSGISTSTSLDGLLVAIEDVDVRAFILMSFWSPVAPVMRVCSYCPSSTGITTGARTAAQEHGDRVHDDQEDQQAR